MEQKVVITKDDKIINELIVVGWRVTSVTAGFIAVSSSSAVKGDFCFILVRGKD